MDQEKASKKAVQIVEAILADMSDRGGLQNEWEAIDSETQEEIMESWAVKIETILTSRAE